MLKSNKDSTTTMRTLARATALPRRPRVGNAAVQRPRVCVVRPGDLLDSERERMWRLMDQHYADGSKEAFLKDLFEKDKVVLARAPDSATIVGFTTIKFLQVDVKGQTFRAFFSGDTILLPAYWGTHVLQRGVFQAVMPLFLSRPHEPLFWFLISKGYKTYLTMTRNFTKCWPRHDSSTPLDMAELLAQLASLRYGEAWDSQAGVLRFPTPIGRLRDDVAPLHADLLADPDIAYFARRNPGHAQGDELCCLARVDVPMLARFLLKATRRSGWLP